VCVKNKLKLWVLACPRQSYAQTQIKGEKEREMRQFDTKPIHAWKNFDVLFGESF